MKNLLKNVNPAVLIIIALVGYLIYTKVSENTENPVVNNNVSTKNDDIKNESNTHNKVYDDITYKLEKTDVITFKYIYRAGEGNEKYKINSNDSRNGNGFRCLRTFSH